MAAAQPAPLRLSGAPLDSSSRRALAAKGPAIPVLQAASAASGRISLLSVLGERRRDDLGSAATTLLSRDSLSSSVPAVPPAKPVRLSADWTEKVLERVQRGLDLHRAAAAAAARPPRSDHPGEAPRSVGEERQAPEILAVASDAFAVPSAGDRPTSFIPAAVNVNLLLDEATAVPAAAPRRPRESALAATARSMWYDSVCVAPPNATMNAAFGEGSPAAVPPPPSRDAEAFPDAKTAARARALVSELCAGAKRLREAAFPPALPRYLIAGPRGSAARPPGPPRPLPHASLTASGALAAYRRRSLLLDRGGGSSGKPPPQPAPVSPLDLFLQALFCVPRGGASEILRGAAPHEPPRLTSAAATAAGAGARAADPGGSPAALQAAILAALGNPWAIAPGECTPQRLRELRRGRPILLDRAHQAAVAFVRRGDGGGAAGGGADSRL